MDGWTRLKRLHCTGLDYENTYLALPGGVGEPVVLHNVGLGEFAGAGGEVRAAVGRLEGGG